MFFSIRNRKDLFVIHCLFPSSQSAAAATAARIHRAGGHDTQGHAQHHRQPDAGHAADHMQRQPWGESDCCGPFV